MQSKTIWCLGMYASASTWLFNAVRMMALQAGTDAVRTYFVSSEAPRIVTSEHALLHIVKSHEISDLNAITTLESNSDNIIVSFRDPRDAVTSLMRYHGMAFDRALGLVEASTNLCLRVAQQKRALLFYYESLFFNDQVTVTQLGKVLNLSLTDALAAQIFAALQRDAVEKYISQMARRPGILQERVSGDLLDPVTHWHSHHAKRDGQVGRWRTMLSSEEIGRVEVRCSGFFVRTI